ncbi:MAG TPA: addiction module protein [Kofleriaceae bacterium]|nr:addiction module protein [Kofleriaceae bacterium]
MGRHGDALREHSALECRFFALERREDLVGLLVGPQQPMAKLSAEEWDSAWDAELHKRVREVRDGTVDLIDGDEVLAELQELSSAREAAPSIAPALQLTREGQAVV